MSNNVITNFCTKKWKSILHLVSRIMKYLKLLKNINKIRKKILASQDYECVYSMRYKNFDKSHKLSERYKMTSNFFLWPRVYVWCLYYKRRSRWKMSVITYQYEHKSKDISRHSSLFLWNLLYSHLNNFSVLLLLW